MERTRLLGILGTYFHFVKVVKKQILKEMIEEGLLKEENRDYLLIINEDKSAHLDAGVLLTIMKSGRKLPSGDIGFMNH